MSIPSSSIISTFRPPQDASFDHRNPPVSLTLFATGEFGYHSDTAIDIQVSSQISMFRRTWTSRQLTVYEDQEFSDHENSNDNTRAGVVEESQLGDSQLLRQQTAYDLEGKDETPRAKRVPKRRPSSPPIMMAESPVEDVAMQDAGAPTPMAVDLESDPEMEQVDSEYEAPVHRKRKRKVVVDDAPASALAFGATGLNATEGTSSVTMVARNRRIPTKKAKARPKVVPVDSSAATSPSPAPTPTPISATATAATTPTATSVDPNDPLPPRRPGQRRGFMKRSRVDSVNDSSDPNPSAEGAVLHVSIISAVLEFPCPYVSLEGEKCSKKFPRWTDYEKHYETTHIGDSGYPWVQKIEAKDCPFRCPHPIPSASRPKSNKGRVVKTVEYGPCDFVTRKNTHDFERHWKGNHVRSEALFIARGNMQIQDARYVNVKEKYEIAYALCPRCPRCEENFTRTDALTRHLRSPCAGGSVGAAVDEHAYIHDSTRGSVFGPTTTTLNGQAQTQAQPSPVPLQSQDTTIPSNPPPIILIPSLLQQPSNPTPTHPSLLQ